MSRFDRSEDMYKPSTYALRQQIRELEERVDNLEAIIRNASTYEVFRNQNTYNTFIEGTE